ncbi:heavy metal translocating P-type ATPase [Enterococcus olivae]
MKQEKIDWKSTAGCTCFLVVGLGIEFLTGWAFSSWLYALAVLAGGIQLTIAGLQELFKEKRFNVDLLMMLAALGAGLIGEWREGALLIFIFSLSHVMEEYATHRSKREINHLLDQQPQSARKIFSNGRSQEIPVAELVVGDHLLVFKGERVPTDGKIIRGVSEIDESVVTGESVPQARARGEDVFGGTVNLGNELELIVTKDNSETLLAQIIRLVEEAQNSQTRTESFIQRIENRYVRVILIGVPLMILFFYFVWQWSLTESLYRGVTLLVVASPCALVASSTPALLSAISNGAKRGVLFKGGTYLETLSEIKSIAFDKTGTLTKGELIVTDHCFSVSEEEILPMVVGLEEKSTHPLAQGILRKWQEDYSSLQLVTEELTAQGIQGKYDEHTYYIGKKTSEYSDSEEIIQWKEEGKTVVYVERDQQFLGAIALLDTLNTHVKEMIAYFHQEEVHTLMLTGDAQKTAAYIAKQAGIQEVQAELLPEDKVRYVKEQKERFGKNAMLGDGINDAPALSTATLGIAMGKGTDVAMDVSDVVIMENDLSKLVYTHRLSKKMKRIIKQNIFFSLTVILLLIFLNIQQTLTIPFAVIGHEGSTILVILNGLRLLRKLPQ